MRSQKTILRVSTLLLVIGLSACADRQSLDVPLNIKTLPPVPEDIRRCFSLGFGSLPDGPLTVGQVEQLWSDDLVRARAIRRCGQRLVEWYDDLRDSWV